MMMHTRTLSYRKAITYVDTNRLSAAHDQMRRRLYVQTSLLPPWLNSLGLVGCGFAAGAAARTSLFLFE